MDYEILAAQLGGKGTVKLPDPNTELVMIGADTIGVKFYNTHIVKYHSDGTVEVNTDGIRTPTTKKRINKYLPKGYKVKKTKGSWVMMSPDESKNTFSDNARWTYSKTEKVEESRINKMTIEEAVIARTKQQLIRFCDDIIPLNEQEDPALAAPGTMPPPPGEGQKLDVPQTAPTGGMKPSKSAGGQNAVQELADEIYELMKKEGDQSEGMLKELFQLKGYQDSDVTAALKVLENDGRLGKRSTYFVGVEETDEEADDAGVTPGAVEGDEDALTPPEGAETKTSPTPAMGPAMRNAMMDDDESELDVEDEDDDDDYSELEGDDSDDELEDDELETKPEPEMGGDVTQALDDIEDDFRDLSSLIKSIKPRLDDIRAKLRQESPEELSAMKSLRTMKRQVNAMYGYPMGMPGDQGDPRQARALGLKRR